MEAAKFTPTGHRRPSHKRREYDRPEDVTEKFYAVALHYADKNLKEVPDLSEYPNLEVLHLDNNQIKDIKDCFDGLSKLQVIHLLGNQLTDIVGCFDGLDSLEVLQIYNNPLSEESISYLQKLRDRGVVVNYED
jgi:hypothetical protein